MRAVARVLLRAAARRWPPSIRDECRREWLAELAVLAAARRRGRMLRFALSLALTRPSLGPRPVLDRRLAYTAAMLLAGPVAALGLGYAGFLLTALGLFGLVFFAALLAFGGLLTAHAGSAGVIVRRRLAAPAVLLPSLAVLLYLPELDVAGYRTLTRPSLVWAGVMLAVLVAVGLTPRPVSWWIGYGGAVGAAWAAVTGAVWLHNGAGGFTLDDSYAWLWFPSTLVELSVGPGPAGTQLSGQFVVADFAEIYPHTLLALGVYAVAYVVGVCEHRDFPEPVAVR